MTNRKNYEMTQAQMDKLLVAMKPVPLIMLQCGMPTSTQERANVAWNELGKEMGFDSTTVIPRGRATDSFPLCQWGPHHDQPRRELSGRGKADAG